MIAKVIKQRGMSWSGSAGTQGTVTQGTMTMQDVYNYPLSPNTSLTDAPTYTSLTQTWAGMDTSAVVTNYNVVTGMSDETITVTYPNGTKSKQISYINPGQYNDGLMNQNETLDSSNTLLGKSKIYMQQGDYASFRPTKIEMTDELNQMTYKTYTYGTTNYNQVISLKEYNYAGSLYRDMRMTYENTNAYYIYHHIFNLVKTNEVYDASNVRQSKTDYDYDTAAVQDTPGVVMYDVSYDPNTPEYCYACGECLEYQDDICLMYAGEEISNEDAAYKGNVTRITQYSDAASSSGAIYYDNTYDITGNQRTTVTNCCQQMSFDYTTSTQYSQPEHHTKGSATLTAYQMTEGATYDFNTSAMKTSTDFNGRTTTISYDTLVRPTLVTLSTGGKKTTVYGDSTLSLTQTAQLADNTVASKTIVTFNGRGQTQISKYQAGTSNWNAIQMKYDTMDRNWKTSLPYDDSTSPSLWTEYTYDTLSRIKQIIAADNSISENFYNESTRPGSASSSAGQTARSRDAWGRERWARTDDFGRLAEVVEPNPTGDGSVSYTGSLVTNYTHDILDRLTQTEQGGQYRYFKYDSLGRLTRQKLAEQTATLNDAGTYVGAGQTGAQWGEAFWYDARSNVTQKTDARGVKTNFNYILTYGVLGYTITGPDPFNRLRDISYDVSGPHDTSINIIASHNVFYDYMTTGNQERIKKIESTGLVKEEYIYDTEGRVSDYNQTITGYGSSYELKTSYTFDTLNRVTDITYPKQYGISGSPRKDVQNSYDVASRLSTLKVDSQQQAGDIIYNVFSQATSMNIGPSGTNQINESSTFDPQTGLLTNQKVTRNSVNLLDLSYDYARNGSVGTTSSGITGSLTKILDNVDHNKDRLYQYDALGRLITAKGGIAAGATGVTANWTQSYTYDRYGNKLTTSASGITANSMAVPVDGLASLSYTSSTNRISTSGYEYDPAGNLTRGQSPSGAWQRYEYDQAGKLMYVKDDTGYIQQTNEYNGSGVRLTSWSYASLDITYYATSGGSVIGEYITQFGSSILTWSKSYVYAGGRLLSTITNSSGSEVTEYQHPDKLGTRLVTNGATQYEQSTLPFGTYLAGESTGATNRPFTSYERSSVANLDFAKNRSYTTGQSRFTQVDPIGLNAVRVINPQSLNMYAYVGNDPINYTDPSGLFMAGPNTWYVTVTADHNPVSWDALYWDLFGRYTPIGNTSPRGDPETLGGGGGQGGEQPNENFSKDCVQMLKDYGVWDKVQEILKNPPLVDVDAIEALDSALSFIGLPGAVETSGTYWFGKLAYSGETVGHAFDVLAKEKGAVVNINPTITNVLNNGDGGKRGIYYRGSQSNLLNEPNWLLHEIVHLVVPDVFTNRGDIKNPDEILIKEFGIIKKGNENPYQTVSRFFNNGCKPGDRKQ